MKPNPARQSDYNPFVDGVIRRSDILAAGHTTHSLSTRCRPGGPWQVLLPGVLLLANSPPNRRQRLKAAALYAGKEAVITGAEAMCEHGLSCGDAPDVHVLIPINRRLSPRNYVRVERTSRMPKPQTYNGLPFAPPHRAAVDAARHARDPTQQRDMLFAPVHAGLCSIEDLRAELKAGTQRGTAGLRALLDEPITPLLTSTVHHGWARRVIKQAPLPSPEWNVKIYSRTGKSLGMADAWWDDVGMAWDFDNQRDNGARLRAEKFTKAGLVLVQTPLPELRGNPEGVVRDLALHFVLAANRPRPPVKTHHWP